jgi:hypothetical protein
MRSTIRLFKALPVSGTAGGLPTDPALDRLTLRRGFVFDSSLVGEYRSVDRLISMVDEVYGRGSVELNTAFHKSFAKVRDASIQQLVFEQIVHYFTTYGAEHFGVYDESSVFVPGEHLDAPELSEGIRVVVIRGLTKAELKTELLTLVSSGIALAEDTIADVLDVAAFVGLDEADLSAITNREVRAALYDHLGIMPSDPQEFLRFLVYRATGQTQVVQNDSLLNTLRSRDNLDLVRYFRTYEAQTGLRRLGEIFLRYRLVFLAMKTNTVLRTYINRIRREAKRSHKPMPEDVLNSVTMHLKRGDLDSGAVSQALATASVFRKARLAYALRYRMSGADGIVYRVRNGRAYATDFSFPLDIDVETVFGEVISSIAGDITPKVDGKKIFIPAGLAYGLPSTEKQFIGHLPAGTSVTVPDGLVVGVHWEDQGDHRINLDLSLSNIAEKIGWDGYYRSSGDDGIYFSGDLTYAPPPNGATEVFRIGASAYGTWLLNLNYFNYNEDIDVPFRILAGHASAVEKNHVVDPNALVANAHARMDVHQRTLGIVVSGFTERQFFFAGADIGGGITSRHTQRADVAMKYFETYYVNAIPLNDILVSAGAELVVDAADSDLDLSPEAVDKNTFLELLTT